MSKTTKTEKIEKVSITLAYPHEHGGETLPAGATLEVWPAQAERILAWEEARRRAESNASQSQKGGE